MTAASSPRPESASGAPAPKLPATVVALGWVSLLTDAASDMIYPLVPAFLLSIGGGPIALGWLEGIAEIVAMVLKLFSGRISDEPRARKPLIALGYGISTLSRPLFAVATSPLHAVVIRAVDRVGKGLRGPPRDAMVAGAVAAEHRGLAFGFHRMMDNFGGVIGPVVAFALLHFLDLPLRQVFALSVVPGVGAVLVVLLFVRDPSRAGERPAAPRKEEAAREGQAIERPRLSSAAMRYFVALFVFSLAGSGDLFLVRRLTDLGLSNDLVPIAWISLQLAKGLVNVPGGRAADRFGRRRVLAMAWVLYGLSYVGFGLAGSWQVGWLLLGLYALHYGLAEGGQRALLAEYVPAEVRGRAYGYQLAIEGGAVLPANVVFGMIYERAGASWAFGAGGLVALLGAVLLALFVPSAPTQGGTSSNVKAAPAS